MGMGHLLNKRLRTLELRLANEVLVPWQGPRRRLVIKELWLGKPLDTLYGFVLHAWHGFSWQPGWIRTWQPLTEQETSKNRGIFNEALVYNSTQQAARVEPMTLVFLFALGSFLMDRFFTRIPTPSACKRNMFLSMLASRLSS